MERVLYEKKGVIRIGVCYMKSGAVKKGAWEPRPYTLQRGFYDQKIRISLKNDTFM